MRTEKEIIDEIRIVDGQLSPENLSSKGSRCLHNSTTSRRQCLCSSYYLSTSDEEDE